MKKILSVKQIREADAFTIKNEPIASIDLMERASLKCVQWIQKNLGQRENFYVFCGPGNNGGDGLAVARLLHENGFKVMPYILKITDRFSEDFKINKGRLIKVGVKIIEVETIADIPEIGKDSVIIDAIFGSGLSKPTKGLIAEVIDRINEINCSIIAIDIPSGLFSDQHSIDVKSSIIRANYTLSFQSPKYAFLLPENEMFVGSWHILPIGLSKEYLKEIKVQNFLLERSDCKIIKIS